MSRFVVVVLGTVACVPSSVDPEVPMDTPTSFVQEDVFTQDLLDPVDTVWVLDPTWEDGFDNLSAVTETTYETLLLSDSDWKAGFTSSDVQNPDTRGIIRGSHQSAFPPSGTWQNPRGKDLSRPLDAIISVFEERGEENEDFFREGAHLHFIVVTNQPDASEADLASFQEVLQDQIDDGLTESIRLSAIVRGSEGVVADWEALTGELGGTLFAVGSWERAATDVTYHGVNRRRVFPLSSTPLTPPREVTVRYRDQDLVYAIGEGVDYLATLEAIRFVEEPPQTGSTIRVRYDAAPQ